jgi:hypothetical protein
MKIKFIQTMLGGLLLAAMLAFTGCTSLPNDGANPQTKHFTDLNQVRYLEVFVVGGNSITGNLQANVYNTTFAPSFYVITKDSAPPAYVASLDLKAVKKQFHALGAALNGPKQWMLDWVDIPLGAEQDINGMKIPWCAELHLTKSMLKTMGKQGYTPTTIARKSAFGYNKGSTVFLIDDADGNTWVMKGFELGLQPRWTFEEFARDPASHFKQLPPGWKFRTKVLDQDLIMVPQTGIATIMPDEFFNVYDKTGPGYSNYKP